MIVANSRKKSPVTYSEIPPFFSLVDYRNNYFTSDDPKKIMEFYNGFENRDQLIQWMRERPKGVANIHEVEGDKEIIVVIPTADFNGKYAKECRDNIFKGFHIIFVESGEIPDPYFNFAHNVNVGIKKAMEYNPKWVVFSNDDMKKIDDIGVLVNELSLIDNNKIKIVFTRQSEYHSVKVSIAQNRTLLTKIYKLLYNLILKSNSYKEVENIKKAFSVKWIYGSGKTLLAKIFFKKAIKLIETSDFSIISAEFCKNEDAKIFNETYINGGEDWELSFKMTRNRSDYTFVNYKIGDLIGGTLGEYDKVRQLRDICNIVYFDKQMNICTSASELS